MINYEKKIRKIYPDAIVEWREGYRSAYLINGTEAFSRIICSVPCPCRDHFGPTKEILDNLWKCGWEAFQAELIQRMSE